MKRTFLLVILIIVLSFCLTACGCEHEWSEATCTAPKTCKLCEATEGDVIAHEWEDANCDSPKTCKGCGLTEGTPVGHSWKEATCTDPKTCEICKNTAGTAAGHTLSEEKTLDYNADTKTLIYTQTCVRCNDSIRDELPINSAGEQALYEAALALLSEEKYEEAYPLLRSIQGYNDVDTLLKNKELQKIYDANVADFKKKGNYVIFGSYEQDKNFANGKDPIEWIVLNYDSRDNTALLISRYQLAARDLDFFSNYRLWYKSDLRFWLNTDFVEAAFTQEEIDAVAVSITSNPDKIGLVNAVDKVFLLSKEEATKYMTKTMRQCGWWFLRSAYQWGEILQAEYVKDDGSFGFCSPYMKNGIRPAIRIDLNNKYF